MADVYREIVQDGAVRRVKMTAAELTEHQRSGTPPPEDRIAAVEARLASVEAKAR